MNCGGKDWRSNVGGDGCLDIGYSSEVGMGMLMIFKIGVLSIVLVICGLGLGKVDNVCLIVVLIFLMKSFCSL